MRRKSIVVISYLLLVSVILVACGAEATATQSLSTQPPAVTITTPTGSPPPPAVTLTGPEPTAENNAQPSPTVEAVIGPETYPAGINPLTGLPVDEAQLNHRILAIKISNFPRYVRPQAGLGQADMVFEHYSEGGTTRFTAIYYGTDAERVGPIRSARLIDTVIPEMFKSALVASGSSNGVLQRLGFKDWFNLVIAETTGYQCPILLCMETEDTNSLYSSTVAIKQVLAGKGYDVRQPFRGVSFSNQVPQGGAAVNSLRIEYSSEARTEWQYNTGTGLYERWNDKDTAEMQPHLDGATNKQITAANVVVLFIPHVVDFSIPEDFDTGGFTGHFSTEIQLWGSGSAWVLRDGQLVQATWVRLNQGDMVGLVDGNNNGIHLKPGQTWYQVVGLTSETVTDGPAWLIRHRSPRDTGEIPGVPTMTPTIEGALPEATVEVTATP